MTDTTLEQARGDTSRGDAWSTAQNAGSRISEHASATREDLAGDLRTLREDVKAMQATLTRFITSSAGEATRAAQSVGASVATQVTDMASEATSVAAQQAKTFASELEGMARRNPLGTIGGAVLVGIVIGLVTRGRG